jgi:hypothetical protein
MGSDFLSLELHPVWGAVLRDLHPHRGRVWRFSIAMLKVLKRYVLNLQHMELFLLIQVISLTGLTWRPPLMLRLLPSAE